MSMTTRTYSRPRVVRLRRWLEDPSVMVRTSFLPTEGMYRYHHNTRVRAAFLLDKRMGRVRG